MQVIDRDRGRFRKIQLGAGRKQNVAPNHIVSAVAERAHIRGSLIGKIEIFDDFSVVGVPADRSEEIARSLEGLRLCGHAASRAAASRAGKAAGRTSERSREGESPRLRPEKPGRGRRAQPGRLAQPSERRRFAQGLERPQVGRRQCKAPPALPREAKARLLDASDLTRYEIGAGAPAGRCRSQVTVERSRQTRTA